MNPKLVNLYLRGQYADCADLDAVLATPALAPALDIDSCELRALGDDRVAVEVAYGLALLRPGDDASIVEISATFCLIYAIQPPAEPLRSRAELVARAVADGWASWRTLLAATLAWMGVVPLQLPAEAPPALCRIAAEVLAPAPDEGAARQTPRDGI